MHKPSNSSPLAQAPPELRQLVSEVLAQDPRPAYKQGKPDDKEYGVRLFDVNVRFQIKNRNAWSWPSNPFEQAVEAT